MPSSPGGGAARFMHCRFRALSPVAKAPHPGTRPTHSRGLAAAWRRFTFIALSLLGSLACTAVSAQPFKFTPAAFQPELTEAAQRAQSNMTGFVFDFANATVRGVLQRSARALVGTHDGLVMIGQCRKVDVLIGVLRLSAHCPLTCWSTAVLRSLMSYSS